MADVTGRDDWIIAEALGAWGGHGWQVLRRDNRFSLDEQSTIIATALYEFIRQQQALGEPGKSKRQWSNEQDAKAILFGRFPQKTKALIAEDRARGIEPPDLIDEKALPEAADQ